MRGITDRIQLQDIAIHVLIVGQHIDAHRLIFLGGTEVIDRFRSVVDLAHRHADRAR